MNSSPLKNNFSSGKVIICDINPNMIEVGKKRAIQKGYNNLSSIQLIILFIFF